MKTKLKPCPFCGVDPIIEPWHGGTKLRRMVSCVNDYCYVNPEVVGETTQQATNRWNERPPANVTAHD